MSEAIDYVALLAKIESPHLAKFGYRAALSRYEHGITVTMHRAEVLIATKNVPFSSSDYYGTKTTKSFDAIIEGVIGAAVEIYDKDNKSFDNPALLQALEEKINGEPVKMLVLTGGPVAEDSPKGDPPKDVIMVQYNQEYASWDILCTVCDSTLRCQSIRSANEDAKIHYEYHDRMVPLISM